MLSPLYNLRISLPLPPHPLHLSLKKRARDDSDELELDSPEVKRLRDDLLNILEDSDPCTTNLDLDSFMKSFEEEISASPFPPATVVDLTADSGESRPDLGYLLEASDDELGLPPSSTSPSEVENNEESELVRVSSDSSGLSELWGFDDQIPSYEFGFGDSDRFNDTNGEYVALDGLFDHSDVVLGSSDYSDLSWWPETLPAQ
ncbi:hypothetical protein F0562_034023 [Nyssa sinensis]|uniref:Uncharacterized protein n=1 Tax=Nyssa sinensis TaxID=561372 RepID=A0A5J5AG38_9ASTE|nr:hypothetical protein F0562_034023 [Nyssa sinensis]